MNGEDPTAVAQRRLVGGEVDRLVGHDVAQQAGQPDTQRRPGGPMRSSRSTPRLAGEAVTSVNPAARSASADSPGAVGVVDDRQSRPW